MKLYYYTDYRGHAGWFKDAAAFRKAFPGAEHPLRVAHKGIEPPAGYCKGARELAFDAIERTPTQRDFIRALTP